MLCSRPCTDLGGLPVSLEIIGDGPMHTSWQTLADQLGLGSVVKFSGWLSQEACALRLQQADVLVLPSLFECGGAVVLEAMAVGLPVIATAWGGPTDYLDEFCGILVKPQSRESLVAGFASAMETLATSPDLRERLGQAGYARAGSILIGKARSIKLNASMNWRSRRKGDWAARSDWVSADRI